MGSGRKYTTIPVSVEVKESLEKLKGRKEWSKFLLELVVENRRLRRKLAARSMQERFSAVESHVLESHEALREDLKLKDLPEGKSP